MHETIQRKVCMLGSFAVGKTSLVARYVRGQFTEKYLTTAGVKIDKKSVPLDDHTRELILWDLAGEDEFQSVRVRYLRGAAGYLLVADGTRAETLDMALELQHRAEAEIGPVPFIVLLNKSDLLDNWRIDGSAIDDLASRGWTIIHTSAKTGCGVEDAFLNLAHKLA